MNTAPIKRHYVYVGDRRVHYRRAGSGPALLLLHASPGSSHGLEGLMQQLATRYTTIALDTPGYGESTGLGLDQPEIADYAAALPATLDALALSRVYLYGSHTGAAIALQFAHDHPARVERLVLDGVPMYTAAETVDRLTHYTPSLAPEADGTHLIRAWFMRRNMFIFSPWYATGGSARVATDVPTAEALHGMMIDFLRAGPDYWQGYQAAFRYAGMDVLPNIGVPTLLDAMPSDSLRAHIARCGELPATITVGKLTDSGNPRDALVERIHGFLAHGELPEAPAVPAVVPGSKRLWRDYVDTSVGQLLVRRSGSAGRRPLVLLHASPASSLSLEPLLMALASDRPVVTFDNPGNGDSAPLSGVPEIADIAAVLLEGIDALGLEDFDLYGTHTGALVAMEIAIAHPQRVRHLILDGVTNFPAEERQDYLGNYLVPLKVQDDGGHLISAWSFLRDQALWWPWYRRTVAAMKVGAGMPSAERLHERFVEFIKGGTTYHLNYRAAFNYPTHERLPLIKTKTLLGANVDDPLIAGTERAGALLANGEVTLFPGTATGQEIVASVAKFAAFFDD